MVRSVSRSRDEVSGEERVRQAGGAGVVGVMGVVAP